MPRVGLLFGLLLMGGPVGAQDLYQYQPAQPRWASPENPDGAKGQGGRENRGAKGHPFDTIRAGQSLTLADVKGAGTIRRMWITISDRSPMMLRALRLEMFWDGAASPAVSVPFGDLFGPGLGRTTPFENALFSSPEARSFNSVVPMPFRTGARLVLTNESDVDLARVYFDVNYTVGDTHAADVLYFHASWRREPATRLGHDFEILPALQPRPRRPRPLHQLSRPHAGRLARRPLAARWLGELLSPRRRVGDGVLLPGRARWGGAADRGGGGEDEGT